MKLNTLHENLPDYMVPKTYIHQEKFLINKNNKIDRKKITRKILL